MQLMDTLPRVLTFAFLLTSMLSVGLHTVPMDVRNLLRDKSLMGRGLAANFVVVPLVGWLMTRLLPLRPESAGALLLLACTPGGLSALHFTIKLRRESLFAAGSTFVLSAIAILLSPLLLSLLHPGHVFTHVPHARPVLGVVVLLLLPLVVGALVRGRWETLAKRLSRLCAVASAILFMVVYVLIFAMRKHAMESVRGADLLYMLFFILVSMAVGWFMGGPTNEGRRALSAVTGMRNVALCLLVAPHALPGGTVQAELVAFSALMLPPTVLLTVYWAIQARHTAHGTSR